MNSSRIGLDIRIVSNECNPKSRRRTTAEYYRLATSIVTKQLTEERDSCRVDRLDNFNLKKHWFCSMSR